MGSVPLVIGSWATNYWFPEFRKGRDIDCYAFGRMKPFLQEFDVQIIKKSDGLIEVAELGGVHTELNGVEVWIAPTSTLLAIKRVHLEFRKKWLKNLCDYVWLLNRGLILDEETRNGFKRRAFHLREKFRDKKDFNKIKKDSSLKEIVDLVENSRVDPVVASEFLLNSIGYSLDPI